MSKKRKKPSRRPYQDPRIRPLVQAAATQTDLVVCAVCKLSLEWVEGHGGARFYEHSGRKEFDHEPHPTLSTPVEANHLCDFCGLQNVTQAFVTLRGIAVYDPNHKELRHYTNPWVTCDTCGELVARGNLAALLDRVVAFQAPVTRTTAKVRLSLRVQIKALYEAFFDAKPQGPFSLTL